MDVYCINLKNRVDRLKSVTDNIDKINSTITRPGIMNANILYEPETKLNLIVIDAIKHKRGVIGCGLSHQKIIKIAIEKNLDNILVIEDDNIMIDSVIGVLYNAISELPSDFDILLGGAHYISYPKKITNNLFKIKKFSGTNFILYNKSSYDHVLKWKRGHIDFYLSNLSNNNKLNTYITYPFVGKTPPDYSDIKKKKTDYIQKFNYYENKLKKLI